MFTQQQIRNVALQFSALLTVDLGRKRMKQIAATNKERNDDTCASHDYCDANMYMDAAITAVTGVPYDMVGGESPATDERTDLWNAAWKLAKDNDFFITINK